jgi:hypothetical protein
MPQRRWTSEEEQRLLDCRARGLSWLQVARSLHRSEASVMGHYLTKLKKRKIIGRPILRLPHQNELLHRADIAIADHARLKNQLLESRWQAAIIESRLHDVRRRLGEAELKSFL